jgi:hypothetical protein
VTAGIYALHDSDDVYRYVGKSKNVAKRLQTHLQRASRKKTPCQCWIWSRLSSGRTIQLTVLETVDLANLNEREKFWIYEMRQAGYPLLNLTPGGDGGPTFTGGQHSVESREKMRVARLGRKPSADHVARAIAGRTSFPQSCVPCRREFKSRSAFGAHYGSVHREGNQKRREAMKKAWAEGRHPGRPQKPPPSHCAKGHSLDSKNLWIGPQQNRGCRTCNREYQRVYRARQRCKTTEKQDL